MTDADDAQHGRHGSDEDRPTVPLHHAEPGETVYVAAISGGRHLQHRLAEMGLTPGAPFTVISKGRPGPFIISVKETRLAIGRGMSHHVRVYRQPDQS